MTLNNQVQALIDQMAANPVPPIWEVSLEEARAGIVARSRVNGAQNVPIGRTEDIKLPGPVGDIGARVYTPIAAGGAALPGLVYFHGGGFVIGNLDTHDAICRVLANEAQARIVSIDYRLAPESPFPGAVEDAFAATKWVEKNAADLGIDANRIGVGGDSAGANLAAVTALMVRDEGDMRLVFQLLNYPVTNQAEEMPSRHKFGEGYYLTAQAMRWYEQKYFARPEDRQDYRASPLLAPSHKGLPPALVITAGYDPLLDEGRAYAHKLNEAGVPTEYREYAGLVHGFLGMAGLVDEAREALVDAGRSLGAALNP